MWHRKAWCAKLQIDADTLTSDYLSPSCLRMQIKRFGCHDPHSSRPSTCTQLSMYAHSVVVLMLIDYAIALFLAIVLPRITTSLTLSRCVSFLTFKCLAVRHADKSGRLHCKC